MFLQKYTIGKGDARDPLRASSRISMGSDGREGSKCPMFSLFSLSSSSSEVILQRIWPFETIVHLLNSQIGEIRDVILCLLDLCGLQVSSHRTIQVYCVGRGLARGAVWVSFLLS